MSNKVVTFSNGYAMPPDDRRCAHIYDDGRRCKGWTTREGDRCTGHSGVSAFTPETARAAQAASARARQRRRYARELARLSPHALTADDVLRIKLAEDAVEVAETMLAPLADPDLSTKTRGEYAAWLQDRARPDRRPDVLAAMTLERARAALAQNHDPRRALAEMSDGELEALAEADVIEGEATELAS